MLANALAGRVDDAYDWVVEARSTPFSAQTDDSGTLVERSPSGPGPRDWTSRSGCPSCRSGAQGQPLVAGASGAERAAVVSLPALGGWRMRSRARCALVDLVRSLHAGQDENGAAELARK
ncbi:MAG: hypothetical protein ACRDP9_14600 [Kribbellaceae bacterium]